MGPEGGRELPGPLSDCGLGNHLRKRGSPAPRKDRCHPDEAPKKLTSRHGIMEADNTKVSGHEVKIPNNRADWTQRD